MNSFPKIEIKARQERHDINKDKIVKRILLVKIREEINDTNYKTINW